MFVAAADQFMGDIALTDEDVDVARQRRWRHQAADIQLTTASPHFGTGDPPRRRDVEHYLPRPRHSSR